MLTKQTLSSKAAIFALLILFIFLGNLKYKQWKSQREIEKQKQTLLKQADDKQKKNDELNQSLQYLNSPSFKERVARQELNFKRDGETVYSFGNSAAANQDTSGQNNKQTNIKKWWGYFFTIQ